jgi:hypothetical protein
VTIGGGSVWAITCLGATETGDCRQGALLRIEGRSGVLLNQFHLPGAGRTFSINYASRSVWTIHYPQGDNSIHLLRLDPLTGRVVADIALPGCCSQDLAVGGGAVWVGMDGFVVRIDPARNEVVAQIRMDGALYLAAGDDAVWVNTSRLGPAPLVRVDSSTNEIVAAIHGPGFGLPVVAAGRPWLATAQGNRRKLEVFTVDPTTNALVLAATVDPGPGRFFTTGPSALVAVLALGEGALWTGTDQSGVLVRIPLSQAGGGT